MVRIVRSLAALLLGASVPLQSALAQEAPVQRQDDIIVEGQRPDGAVPLVDKLTKAPAGRQVARWYNWVCIKVDGVDPAWTDYLETEVAKIAGTAGVHSERRPCAAPDTIYVIVTSYADAYTQKLVKNRPGLYRDTFRFGLASRKELAVLKAPRAVRWFEGHQFQLVNPFGTRTEMMGREEKSFSVFIVDAKKLSGVSWQQLAAYIAMASLTNPGMDEHYDRDDTILALFDRRDQGRPTPAGLTRLDRDVLRGFYSFSDKLPGYQQRHQIAGSIERSRAATP